MKGGAWRFRLIPKLSEVGDRRRTESPVISTTVDMREICPIRRLRHITCSCPEIEMPGHAGRAARAYPEFFDAEARAFNPRTPRLYDASSVACSRGGAHLPRFNFHFGGDEVAGRDMGRAWAGSVATG